MDWLKLLGHLGSTTETVSKIQFGQGVVGKTSLIVLLTILALTIISLRVSDQWILLLLAGCMLGLAVWYTHTTRAFAKSHPDLALMDGATLYAWKKVELAAKGVPQPLDAPSMVNPVVDGLSLTHDTAATHDTTASE